MTVEQEKTIQEIENLIRNFKVELKKDDLRSKVTALVPVFHELRKMGRSLVSSKHTSSARERILYYFRKYPKVVIAGDELMVVSGIQEYTRRIRELRVQFGWAVASGVTIKEMLPDQEMEIPDELRGMKPDDYVLLDEDQDRDAAHRWNLANSIRKEKGSVRSKILKYLRKNVGKQVTNEELRYVSENKTEWARRVRELRIEFGWPIVTKSTGRPDLALGAYMLEADRQGYEHDRRITDNTRREVLRRDGYKCSECGWSHEEWNPSDPRHLELHHIQHHSKGGKNIKDNLQTLCTICHDEIHKI